MSYPFIEARFPGCPSFGFQWRPFFMNEHIESATGAEYPFRHWSYPLHDCQVTVGPRMDDEIDELLSFFLAVGGSYHGFRVKNHGEFKSCRPSETPTGADQPMVATGVALQYQLVKRYTIGSSTLNRPIKKPVSGTITMLANGSPAAATLNYATGIATFGSTPTGPLTWGGEFDLPMRFEGEFPLQIIDKRAITVSFMLKELRNPG